MLFSVLFCTVLYWSQMYDVFYFSRKRSVVMFKQAVSTFNHVTHCPLHVTQHGQHLCPAAPHPQNDIIHRALLVICLHQLLYTQQRIYSHYISPRHVCPPNNYTLGDIYLLGELHLKLYLPQGQRFNGF